MPLTRPERFRLKSKLVDAASSEDWTLERTNLLLAEFGLESVDDNWQSPSFSDRLIDLDDVELIEMASIVMNIDQDEAERTVGSDASNLWRDGYVHVFLSHVAAHRQYVSEVSAELETLGIQGFVAHDSLQVSRPWQSQIESALRSMQALVALVHPEFNSSAWCQQEVGWALGRRVPVHVVRLGADPLGCLTRDQWTSMHDRPAADVASLIGKWVSDIPELGQSVVDGLIETLATASNYVAAGDAAQRIVEIGSLTEAQFARIDEAWPANNQLHGGILPSNAMRPFYEANGRPWPPAPVYDEPPF